MSIHEAFAIAFKTVADPFNFALVFLGAMLGLLMGIFPGLGGIIALSLLIPLTFGMDPLVAFMLLIAMNGGTNFGGSISAILINTPGGSPNAATVIDGYPMTRKGEGGRAISAAATASALGAIFGIAILIISIPILRRISLLFGPAEIFWLGIWGVTMIAIIVRGSVISGIISGILGFMFVMHGLNTMTANLRWTYGYTWMLDGFKLVPALIGLFALAEMIKLITEGGTIAKGDVEVGGGKLQGIKDVFIHRKIFLLSALIGTIIGTIPGIGGSAANFIAYFQAVQSSNDSETYGTGDVRGVIAPEASNDAKDGGALIPTLGLGVPGSAAMAVLFGAFILHGIQPGPLLFRDHPEVIAVIIVSLLISNIITSTVGILSIDYLIKITKINVFILAPPIILVSYFGAYAVNNTIFDLNIAVIFGVLGFVMIKINMSRIPLILGMVLGPIVEDNYFRALQIGKDHSILVESPLAKFLTLLIIVSFFLPYVRQYMETRA